MDCNMEKGDIRWFTQGKLNVTGVHDIDYYAKFTVCDIPVVLHQSILSLSGSVYA